MRDIEKNKYLQREVIYRVKYGRIFNILASNHISDAIFSQMATDGTRNVKNCRNSHNDFSKNWATQACLQIHISLYADIHILKIIKYHHFMPRIITYTRPDILIGLTSTLFTNALACITFRLSQLFSN